MSILDWKDSETFTDLRKLESVLNNKSESFPNKVESLIQVWRQVGEYHLTDYKQHAVHLMDWLKLHTLNIVLTGDWRSCQDGYKKRLLEEVEHCEMLLRNSNNIFSLRCKKLAEIIRDPWGSPILSNLLNTPDTVIGSEEIEFFCNETGYLISTRLIKLCEDHCQDLALNLVTSFMQCSRIAEEQHIVLNATEDQRRFILDIYVALLFKYKRTSSITAKLKSLPLNEGLKLLKRFAHKRVNISKIWKNSAKIAHLAAHVYLTAAVRTVPDNNNIKVLEGLLEVWLSLSDVHNDPVVLMRSITHIIQNAESAVHLYVFCEAVYKKFGTSMKIFTLELFIRALTTDVNDIERHKNENDTTKVAEITQRLARGFLRLADILDEDVNASRECVLTSFSLLPTQSTLDRIVQLAVRSGYEILDTGQMWKCKLHPPAHPSNKACTTCTECGEVIGLLKLTSPININTALSEALSAERLGIPSEYCDDLVVLLSSPRYQLLTWLLKWEDLYQFCVRYLNDPDRTKNFVTELKFVNIDYSVYARMKPVQDESTGIERGYEKYLESELYCKGNSSSSEEDQNLKFAVTNSNIKEVVNPLPSPSVKPPMCSTKTLRQFRPNLKRPKPYQPYCELPHKIFIANQPVSPSVNTQSASSIVHHNMECTKNSISYPSVPVTNSESALSKNIVKHVPYNPSSYQSPVCSTSDSISGVQGENNTSNVRQDYNFVSSVNCEYRNSTNMSTLNSISQIRSNLKPVNNFSLSAKRTKDTFLNNVSLTDSSFSNLCAKKDFNVSLPKNPYKSNNQSSTVITHPNSSQRFYMTENSITNSGTQRDVSINTNRNVNLPANNTSPVVDPEIICIDDEEEENAHPSFENQVAFNKPESTTTSSKNVDSSLGEAPNISEPEVICIDDEEESEQVLTEKATYDTFEYLVRYTTPLTVTNAYNNGNPSLNAVNPEREARLDSPRKTIENPDILALERNMIAHFTQDYYLTNMIRYFESRRVDMSVPFSVDDVTISDVEEYLLKNGWNAEGKFNASPQKDIDANVGKIVENSDINWEAQIPTSSVNNLNVNLDHVSENRMKSLEERSVASPKNDPDTNLDKLVPNTPASVEAVENTPDPEIECQEETDSNLNRQLFSPVNSDFSMDRESPEIQSPKFASSDQGLHSQNKDFTLPPQSSENKHLLIMTDLTVEGKSCFDSAYNTSYARRTYSRRSYKNNNLKVEESVYRTGRKNKDCTDLTNTTQNSDVHVNMHEEKKSISTDKMRNLFKKYKLKEVQVVLHRLTSTDISYNKNNYPSKYVKSKNSKPRRKCGKKIPKKSENKKTRGWPKGKKRTKKPWPLQDINPQINEQKDCLNSSSLEKVEADYDTSLKMNPRVVLRRLELDDKKRAANSVLASVPGLNDLQMIRPSSVDRIVHVIQVPGTRSAPAPMQSTQASTQISPHIQRIGQPRNEKPEASHSQPSTTSTAATTTTAAVMNTTEPSTLINILSQQIVRPGNQCNIMTLRPRTSPLINILSQQIIKPVSTTTSAKVSSTGNSDLQVNSIPRVITGGEQILSQLINPVRAPAPTLKTLVSTPTSDQNRIVQFICKASDGKLIPVTSFTSNKVVKVSMTQTVSSSGSGTSSTEENFTKVPCQTTCKVKTDTENPDTLPKFQQAFGKPAYQKTVDSTERVSVSTETVNSEIDKSGNGAKSPVKNSNASLNIQPVQGGVIYTRQMPVGQTINLIPPGRGQVFRIATSNPEQLSLVKDTVIHGKMSALLAAALQGKPRTGDNNEVEISSEENSTNSRATVTARPTLVQNARIVKPVLQIPSNVIRSVPQSNLSSTTLEQLREFDMVYKQVKERSSTGAPIESSPQSDSSEPPQQISVTYLNQSQKINCSPVVVVSSYCNVHPAASPSLSVTSQGSSSPCVTPAPTLALSKTITKTSKTKNIKSATPHTAKTTPIPKPQQKPQEDEHTTQRIFDILAEYAEQLRNSPDLNNKPAPRRRSNPPTNPNQNAKRKKNSNTKKTGQCSNSLTSDGDLDDAHTAGSEDSSCGVQISVQEEEQPLSSSVSEANEASISPKQLILTESSPNQSRNLIIADSNVGEALKMSNTAVIVPGNYIMPVSMVKGGQQIAVVSGGSKILATVPARSGPNMLLFQSFLNQTRKHNLPTVKYSAVQPVSGITRTISNSQSSTTLPPTSQNVTAVTLAQTVPLQKINQVDHTNTTNFDTELLLTISQQSENKNVLNPPLPPSSPRQQQKPQQLLSNHEGTGSSSMDVQNLRINDSILNSEGSSRKPFIYEEKSLVNTSIATSVIAQSVSMKEGQRRPSTTQTVMALNLNSTGCDKDTAIKVEGRVQSVLVAAGTVNGPMLSHSPPTYKQQPESTNSISESNKDEYIRSEGKQTNNETKSLQSSVYTYQGKVKKNQRVDRELQQLTLQRKQAALERELRLQKSLSEECEDLGVDEPSTSDLFPEADLLFDSNHSPSYDHTSQDLVKRTTQDSKEETKGTGLFCDDEPIRADFLFDSIEYPSNTDLEYNRARDMSKGQGTSTAAGLSCEDNTLLQTCTSMSDVTIPSPLTPDPYGDTSSPPFTKCKYKYTNKKKMEKSKPAPENWPIELLSSEDTTGSSEPVKSSSCSPELCSAKRNQSLSCEEEMYRFAIVEKVPIKTDGNCENVQYKDVSSCPSGRGARRSIKKRCPCCNGSTDVSRKRSASRPSTPIPQKKTVIAKKR